MSLLKPASTAWLLAHEMRLNWRTFRGGRMGRAGGLAGTGILGVMALLAGGTLAVATRHLEPPITPLSVAVAALAAAVIFTLMLSQTLSASSEALYTRGDLDLLFSAPIAPAKVLTVRALGVAATAATLFFLILTPLLLPAVLLAHPAWLGAFAVLGALALAAAAAGLVLAMALFALIGPKRTRTAAQVLAALVGAVFFLVSQARAILGAQRSTSLFGELVEQAQTGRLKPPPGLDILLRAMLGQPLPLLIVVVAAVLLFCLATFALGRRFAAAAAAAQGADSIRRPAAAPRAPVAFAAGPFMATLRKELRLILRDPAVLSQTLLSVFYLLPTAFLVTRGAAHHQAATLYAVGAGGVVFLAGQVAGGLAWATLSAEESRDLLSVAPAPIWTLRRAKLAAAIIPVAVLLIVPVAVLAVFAPWAAVATTLGSGLSALACGLINVWHQRPALRKDFRRRNGAVWYATLAQLFVCALIAGATSLAVAGQPLWGLAPLAAGGLALLALRRSDAQIAKTLRLVG